MKTIYFRKIFNLISFVFARIIILVVHTGSRKDKNNSILITRLDSIGDYILFRNFLKIIKSSKKFDNYSLTLCGNILWKDLAETLDSNVIKDFIWIDRNKFYQNVFYKYKVLKDIYDRSFTIAINSTYSREVIFGDIIIIASKAELKIGSGGSLDKHSAWKRTFFTNSFYDKVIEQRKENLFEFERNKEFFEKLTEEKISIKKPIMDLAAYNAGIKLPGNYVVIFPGAADEKRRWNSSGFLKIVQFVVDQFKIPVVISGSASEVQTGKMIVESLSSEMIIDLTSKTSINQLAKIISDCRLLIANDTGAIHIAAAVNKPFICISNGNHYGRFTPYPDDIFDKFEYLYPPEIMNNLNKPDELATKYRFNSMLDINTISAGQVIEKINIMLNKY